MNDKNQVLLFERMNSNEEWQFPQGGVEHRESPRTCIPFDLAVLETCRIDTSLQAVGKRIHQRAQCFWRQLFGADLDEKVSCFTHFDAAPATDSIIGKPSASRLA